MSVNGALDDALARSYMEGDVSKEGASAVSLVWTMVTEVQPASAGGTGGGGLAWRTEKVMRVDEK